MNKLIISKNYSLLGRTKKHPLKLNSLLLDEIKNGQSKEYILDDGLYILEFKGAKPVKFKMKNNKTIKLKIKYSNLALSLYSMPVFFIGLLFIIKDFVIVQSSGISILLTFGLIITLYFMTFGKNKILKIVVVK